MLGYIKKNILFQYPPTLCTITQGVYALSYCPKYDLQINLLFLFRCT